MREQWAKASSAERTGAYGLNLMKRYKQAAHSFLALTGTKAPAIYMED